MQINNPRRRVINENAIKFLIGAAAVRGARRSRSGWRTGRPDPLESLSASYAYDLWGTRRFRRHAFRDRRVHGHLQRPGDDGKLAGQDRRPGGVRGGAGPGPVRRRHLPHQEPAQGNPRGRHGGAVHRVDRLLRNLSRERVEKAARQATSRGHRQDVGLCRLHCRHARRLRAPAVGLEGRAGEVAPPALRRSHRAAFVRHRLVDIIEGHLRHEQTKATEAARHSGTGPTGSSPRSTS